MHLPPDSLGKQPIEDTTLEKTTVTPSTKGPEKSEIPETFQQALNELSDNFTKVGLDQKFPPGTEAEHISREEIDELAAQMLKQEEDPYGVEELVKELTPFAEETDTTMVQYADELAKELESVTEELLKESEDMPIPTHLPPPPVPPETDHEQTSDELGMHSETENPKVASKKTPPPFPPQSSKPKLTSRESPIAVEKPVGEEPPSTIPKPLESSRITPLKTETSKPQKEGKRWWSNLSNIRNLFGGLQLKKPTKKAPAQVTIRHNISVGDPQGFAKKGVTLQELLKQAGQAELLSEIPNETKEIPPKQKAFVNHLIKALRKNHLGEQGLTRIPGNKDQVDELRSNLEQYADDPEKLADKEPHALASALSEEIRKRSYLFGQQEMENLLRLGEGELYSDTEGNIQLSTEDIHALNDMNILDGHPNADVIRELLDLCIDIVNNQETTKMGLSNVVMTLSPVFIDQDLVMGGEDPGTRMKNRDKVIMKLLAYRCMKTENKLQLPKTHTTAKAESQEMPDSRFTEEGQRQIAELEREVAGTSVESRNLHVPDSAGTPSKNVDEFGQKMPGADDVQGEEITTTSPERQLKLKGRVITFPPAPPEPIDWKRATVKTDAVAREQVAGVRIGGEREPALKDIDEIDKMYETDEIKLSDRDFMIGFLEASQRYTKQIGRKAMGEDAAIYGDADLKDVWTQETQLATADAMVRAYDELDEKGKTVAKNNINDLAQIGVIPQRIFALFYGRIDEGLVPDIRYEPRQLAPEKNIKECVSKMRTAKGTQRETFASDLAAAFKQHQLEKYEKLNILNINDGEEESVQDIAEYFDNIKSFMQTAIITGGMTGIQPKRKVIRRMIKTVSLVGKKAMDDGDYATALAVLTALESPDVSALIDDCKFDSNGETRKRIKELKRVFDPSKSYADLRNHMKTNESEQIVPIVLIKRDLTPIIEGNPDIIENKFNTKKVKMIQKQISPIIEMRKPRSKTEIVSVPYNLTNLPKQSEDDLLIIRKLFQELTGRPIKRKVVIPDDIKTEFQKTKEGQDIDIESESGKMKLKEFALANRITAAAMPEAATTENLKKLLEDIEPTATRIFDANEVIRILSNSDDNEINGRELGEYYIQVGSHMKLEDKEEFLKLLSGAKGNQANLAKGFVEALLRDDREHFPLLKSLLQLSFRQDIRSTTDPTTLLRGENIGTRMASQAYQILGTKFSEIITSKLVEVLPEESLEIQPAKLTDEEKAKGEELLQSRQTQLLGLTGVVYATLTENIDQMPEEMKELFQMVHDEVEAAGFGKDAARKAFNSQMYLRFVSRTIPIDTARKFTEATDANRNKRRTCTLLSKMVTNHANELKTSIKEPHMEFMFSKSGENLRDKMMNLTDTMSKPKAKTQLGGFIKTAIPKHSLGRKKRMAGTHRPRSMSAGTLGSHRSRAKGATESAKKAAESPPTKKKSVGWKQPESSPSTNIVEDVKNLAESYVEGKHLETLNQLTLLLENEGDADALLMVFSEELGDKLTEFLNQQITVEFQEMNIDGIDLRYDAFKIINQDRLAYKMMNLIFNQNVKSELKEKLLSLDPSELNDLTVESFQSDLPQPLSEAFDTQHELAMASIRHAFGLIPNEASAKESAQKMLKSLLFSFLVDSSWTKSENDQERQMAEWYQKEFPGVVDFESVKERPSADKTFKPLPPLKMPKKEE